MKGILGRKLGMTQVFTAEGKLIPVTVIEATPNIVMQKKTVESDGYEAVQLGFEDVKENRTNKAAKGHAAKANTTPKRFIREVQGMNELEVGAEVKVDIFSAGDKVDVTGVEITQLLDLNHTVQVITVILGLLLQLVVITG